MVTLVVHHRVRDYDAWKPAFDGHEWCRRDHGAIEHRVYRDIHDPNRVVVHMDFPAEENAKAFLEDPSLKEAMEGAGVEGEPGVSFIDRAERKAYTERAVA